MWSRPLPQSPPQAFLSATCVNQVSLHRPLQPLPLPLVRAPPTHSPSLPFPHRAAQPPPATATTEEFKTAARSFYKQMEDSGVEVAPQGTVADKVVQELFIVKGESKRLLLDKILL